MVVALHARFFRCSKCDTVLDDTTVAAKSKSFLRLSSCQADVTAARGVTASAADTAAAEQSGTLRLKLALTLTRISHADIERGH